MFVRTRSLSNAVTFFQRAYLAPKHTEVTINTSPTSSVMWPFDTPCVISYRCSTVTESVSPAVFEIMGPEHFGDTSLTFQGHVTLSVKWPIDTPGYFLLVVHCNQVSISKRFRDIRPQIPVRAPTQTFPSDFIFCPMECIALDRQLILHCYRHRQTKTDG